MISYKRDVLERQSLSEVKMGRGSPICERVRKTIVEYFKNNVPQCQIAKALQNSSSVHNIIKSFRETGEISVRKGQDWRPLLDARGLRALRRHCNTHRHDSVIDITKWAQEYFQKPLSVNTICRAICRCQLKLYHAKREAICKHGPEVPSCPVGQGSFKMDCFKVEKCSMVRRVQIWHSCWKSRTPCPPGRQEEEGDLPACYHKCNGMEQLACFGRHYECWKVYKGFRATYSPLQMSISGKALCISAGQCKTTYCSYYNSMAS